MQRFIGISFLTISSCAPQKHEEKPSPYPVPLFQAPPQKAHPSCAAEAVYCNFYSDYEPLFVFKCHNSQHQPRIYALETTPYKEKRWYETKLRQDINNQTFSEYCKSTFDNYKWFMQETGYEKQ